jgi:hypothetical protein
MINVKLLLSPYHLHIFRTQVAQAYRLGRYGHIMPLVPEHEFKRLITEDAHICVLTLLREKFFKTAEVDG